MFFTRRSFTSICAATACGCSSPIGVPALPTAPFDYVDYFGGKQFGKGIIYSKGSEASNWVITPTSNSSQEILWKGGTKEQFRWDDDLVYATGWFGESNWGSGIYDDFFRLDVASCTLTENGVDTLLATSGPQIYAYRRKDTPYTLTTVGRITQLRTGIVVHYKHIQDYSPPAIVDNKYLGPHPAVAMRERWWDDNQKQAMTLVLDRVVTYAKDLGPAFTINQTVPNNWVAEMKDSTYGK